MIKKNIFLDASPSYLSSKEAAYKILKYNPYAKLIVIMLNPVYRAFSALKIYRQMNILAENETDLLF
jgi:hypothetical protein